MLLKSGLIRVGQKQIDRFSLVMRFTLLLWLTLQVTAKPGQMCTGFPCLLTLGLILPLALRSHRVQRLRTHTHTQAPHVLGRCSV